MSGNFFGYGYEINFLYLNNKSNIKVFYFKISIIFVLFLFWKKL